MVACLCDGIFQNVFTCSTQVWPLASWCGMHWVITLACLWCLYIQYLFQFILLIFLLQQDNVCPHDVMLLNMLCNMFNSFPGWYNSQSYFLLDIQVLLYCINRCKRHKMMYCKRVFIIHTIVWMQEYRLALRIYSGLILGVSTVNILRILESLHIHDYLLQSNYISCMFNFLRIYFIFFCWFE